MSKTLLNCHLIKKVKKLTFPFFTIVLILFFNNVSWSQNITLSSQAEVDALDQSVTNITGYLKISGNDIIDLSNLSNITSVSGHLDISNNEVLTNLDGLSNLISANKLTIGHNGKLTNLDGLSNITSVGDNILIINNDKLNNLDGLHNVTYVIGYLSISDNFSSRESRWIVQYNFCG